MSEPWRRFHKWLTVAGHIHTSLWIIEIVGGSAVIATVIVFAQRLLHLFAELWMLGVVFVVGAIMFLGAVLIEKLVTHHAPARTTLQAGEELKLCVASLAGRLFSLLFEIGEKLDAPIMTFDQQEAALFGDHPPDPRITSRASEQKIADRLKEVYSRADDLGALPRCVSWSTAIADVQDVRSRISDLLVLNEALIRRFPDQLGKNV